MDTIPPPLDAPVRMNDELRGATPEVTATRFLRVTEQAALASARWQGRGKAKAADKAAVDAMRSAFSELPISGTVVIGEGEKDDAPELFVGERLGSGGMECEIAVDPLEGTDLVARGDAGAITICAIGEPGGFMSAPDMYMEKLCVGASARGRIDLRAPIRDTVDIVARCYDRRPGDITAIVLDRPRHAELIEDLRSAGARIRLIADGDITACMSAAVRGTGDHIYVGIGASAEGVITAAAMECLGGEIQSRFWPQNDEQRARLAAAGITNVDRVMSTRDLAQKPIYVIATGVTDGNLLKGVRYFSDGARTHSIVMDLRMNTVRFVDTVHMFTRNPIREIRL